MRTLRANKVPGSLSVRLDTVLKDGHDMYTFGMGTVAALASRKRYGRFTSSMHEVYFTMEEELDKTSSASTSSTAPVALAWGRLGQRLRRAELLRADLSDVVADVDAARAEISPGTREYVEAVRRAGLSDREKGGGRLLGHLYCRYLADLFGGQMLAAPTRAALALKKGTPRHYDFGLEQAESKEAGGARRAMIEEVYGTLNEAGELMSDSEREEVVAEARDAFRLNAVVYGEEPMVLDAALGVLNIGTGFMAKGLYGY